MVGAIPVGRDAEILRGPQQKHHVVVSEEEEKLARDQSVFATR
jgi:hypothetical protein